MQIMYKVLPAHLLHSLGVSTHLNIETACFTGGEAVMRICLAHALR